MIARMLAGLVVGVVLAIFLPVLIVIRLGDSFNMRWHKANWSDPKNWW